MGEREPAPTQPGAQATAERRPAGKGAHGVAHLYVHLPFCVHRCGYCDFVTAVGSEDLHGAYVDGLLRELEGERVRLTPRLETVYLGGGTPTFTERGALHRLLRALPPAAEVTIEANPETVTPQLAELLRELGVTRVSLGAQSFRPRLLEVLERRTTPAQVRSAFTTLRRAGFDNLSLDLIYGIPGQTEADVERDLDDALALGPEHVSAYELEAKPGTRFTHAWADELARQAEMLEGLAERVVERLVDAGFRWYETANFCRGGVPDRRAMHNLAVWQGADYLGLGVGAVSTLGGERRRNRPSIGRYLAELGRGARPPREIEELDARTRAVERLMLALRLDEFVELEPYEALLDASARERLVAQGLLERAGGRVRIADHARLLGDAVTAALLD
jgi:oxygen-independent coproporphyrinogen III oxidase